MSCAGKRDISQRGVVVAERPSEIDPLYTDYMMQLTHVTIGIYDNIDTHDT